MIVVPSATYTTVVPPPVRAAHLREAPHRYPAYTLAAWHEAFAAHGLLPQVFEWDDRLQRPRHLRVDYLGACIHTIAPSNGVFVDNVAVFAFAFITPQGHTMVYAPTHILTEVCTHVETR